MTQRVSEDDFLAFAARVLGVSPGALTLDSVYGAFPAWDSVMHLRLAMEFEVAWGVRLPFDEVPQMVRLRDFYERLSR